MSTAPSSSISATVTASVSTASPAAQSAFDAYLDEWSGSYPTAICALFMVCCPAFVALRFWARHLHHARWGLDDWMILPALFSVLASQAIDMALIHAGGIGRHVAYWEIHDPDVVTTWLKLAFGVEFLYLFCICLTKLSLLSIYLRVLVRETGRYITWILVGITITAWVAQTIACCLQCIPFAYQWDKTIPGGWCFNQQHFYEYLSVSNLVTDLVMLVLPIPTVWALKIRTHQKWALAVVFLSGSVGFIASILRFITYFRVDLLSDVTFKSGQLIMWTIIEPGMYTISACLPAMRPLLQRVLVILGVVKSTNADDTRTFSTDYTRRGSTLSPRVAADQFGDKTPLAVADIELAEPPQRESRFRRPSSSDLPSRRTVTTHISSSGRSAVVEGDGTIDAVVNPDKSLGSDYDGTGRKNSDGRMSVGPGQILVTTDVTQHDVK